MTIAVETKTVQEVNFTFVNLLFVDARESAPVTGTVCDALVVSYKLRYGAPTLALIAPIFFHTVMMHSLNADRAQVSLHLILLTQRDVLMMVSTQFFCGFRDQVLPLGLQRLLDNDVHLDQQQHFDVQRSCLRLSTQHARHARQRQLTHSPWLSRLKHKLRLCQLASKPAR